MSAPVKTRDTPPLALPVASTTRVWWPVEDWSLGALIAAVFLAAAAVYRYGSFGAAGFVAVLIVSSLVREEGPRLAGRVRARWAGWWVARRARKND